MKHVSAFINAFFGRIASLRGTHNFVVQNVLSQFLRSVRLVLHPKLCIYKSTYEQFAEQIV